MLNLVKKDLKLSGWLQKIVGVLYALFIAGMGINMPNQMIANLLYILAMVSLIFILVIYTNGYDDKNKSEIILNSFPIDRVNIVRAKYLTLILFIVFGTGIVYLFSKIALVLYFGNSGGASIWNIIFVFNISLIFYSIYYPLYFKLGDGIRLFNTILWMLMVIGPSIISKSIKKMAEMGHLEKILTIDINRLNIYLLLISLIMFYISLQISKGIYLKREF
ncbi:ABC-2 transporter permease [Tepidimicrobium xylanilyticum]|uniref:ABC-2 family transporter protein n=1 Tax=Tepidimicrobium xylanilyticum TaxID=1123352 RepID=A0A1H2XBM6_9FIRM|nr:ABC-2 transporter permease [Tepidimicrobium xylanilyticum]GMG97443.1 membrane protein [Tepidimicrobium xylanilyticum]SDW89689.1 ABC-2 family transporter protein [Tepidimicrobium xylanilyticum]